MSKCICDQRSIEKNVFPCERSENNVGMKGQHGRKVEIMGELQDDKGTESLVLDYPHRCKLIQDTKP